MTYPKETRPPNRLSPLSLIYPCHVALGSTLRFQMTLFTYPSAINCGWQKLLTFRPFHLAIERSLIIDIHEWWVSPGMGWLYPYAFSHLRISVGWIFMRVQCHGFFMDGPMTHDWYISLSWLGIFCVARNIPFCWWNFRMNLYHP